MSSLCRYSSFPYIGFVNITVKGTRYYYHGYFIQKNLIQRSLSVAWYREMFGHSVPFENEDDKGQAILLNERREGTKEPPGWSFDDKFGISVEPKYSRIFPVGNRKSLRRTRLRVPSEESGDEMIWESLTCVEGTDCSTMFFTEERFNGFGSRLSFTSGTYTEIPKEEDWLEAIRQAYEVNLVSSQYRKPVPMEGCLVDGYCFSEEEWCSSGDPSCQEPEEEDAELRSGVIASFVVFGVIFVVAGLYFLWRSVAMMSEKRFRTCFISRVAEDISLQKAMKEITSENMTREFNFIDKERKGYITKGELLNFLQSTQLSTQPIKEAEFGKLWKVMDLNKNGVVRYPEFCAFTADCYKEHYNLRNQLILDAKKSSQPP